MTARHEWESMSEQAQFRLISNCIRKAARKRGLTVDPADYAGDTWLKLTEKLDSSEEALPLLVFKSADSALLNAVRQDRKYAAASDFTVTGADGEALGSILELVAGVGSVESEAILRADFAKFYTSLDPVNQMIIAGRVYGDTHDMWLRNATRSSAAR